MRNRISVRLFVFFKAVKIKSTNQITLNTQQLKLTSVSSHTADDDKIKILQNIDNINKNNDERQWEIRKSSEDVDYQLEGAKEVYKNNICAFLKFTYATRCYSLN